MFWNSLGLFGCFGSLGFLDFLDWFDFFENFGKIYSTELFLKRMVFELFLLKIFVFL